MRPSTAPSSCGSLRRLSALGRPSGSSTQQASATAWSFAAYSLAPSRKLGRKPSISLALASSGPAVASGFMTASSSAVRGAVARSQATMPRLKMSAATVMPSASLSSASGAVQPSVPTPCPVPAWQGMAATEPRSPSLAARSPSSAWKRMTLWLFTSICAWPQLCKYRNALATSTAMRSLSFSESGSSPEALRRWCKSPAVPHWYTRPTLAGVLTASSSSGAPARGVSSTSDSRSSSDTMASSLMKRCASFRDPPAWPSSAATASTSRLTSSMAARGSVSPTKRKRFTATSVPFSGPSPPR
mmetsp:Transcript_26335/g.82016  ORF Transcript_26335/g.82016 Transcript_26335/m.82016 type:complete len:301 (+) Transcript_26335:1495-2397(+)